MTDRNEINARKEAAYIRGQNDGYANKTPANPFDPRTQDDEWCGYMDGYEDGRDQYENEAKA